MLIAWIREKTLGFPSKLAIKQKMQDKLSYFISKDSSFTFFQFYFVLLNIFKNTLFFKIFLF
jgi:hypothetical protein